MSSTQLGALLSYITEEDLNIHSVLVVRNGYLVLEAYKYPYTSSVLHHIYSCTKSITSTLVGIVMAQGSISSLDQPMLDFFPDRTIANLDHSKESITLEHLLTMSSGMDWSGDIAERSILGELVGSDDWLQFVLDRSMKDSPGERFVYNSGGSNLLAAIVEQAIGQDLLEFARTNLFEPMGIQTADWSKDPQGHHLGGWGLSLTPRNMAKFGYLFLNNGQWDGQQIVPAAWAATATQQHVEATQAHSLSDGYGYQWWVDSQGHYMALGYGGQYIIVHPKQNLVVVFTSGLAASDFSQPEALFSSIILPSIQSDEALPENAEGKAMLEAALYALANPTPTAVSPLPETASRISGVTYQLEDWNWNSISLTFGEGANTAQLLLNGQQFLDVGLDNLFRVNRLPDYDESLLLKGYWRRDDWFLLRLEVLGSADWLQLRLTFSDHEVQVFVSDSDGFVHSFGGTAVHGVPSQPR